MSFLCFCILLPLLRVHSTASLASFRGVCCWSFNTSCLQWWLLALFAPCCRTCMLFPLTVLGYLHWVFPILSRILVFICINRSMMFVLVCTVLVTHLHYSSSGLMDWYDVVLCFLAFYHGCFSFPLSGSTIEGGVCWDSSHIGFVAASVRSYYSALYWFRLLPSSF